MTAPFLGHFTDLPIAPFAGWSTVGQIDGVLNQHDWGQLRASAMLVDAMMRDDRISGVMDTRIGSLLASPLDCVASNESAKARKIALEIGGDEAQPGIWSQIVPDSTLYSLLKYGRFLGMMVGEILWKQIDGKWIPRIRWWHPQWLYWDWSRFVWRLITAEGTIDIPNTDRDVHSDGHWFVYAPHGYQYGWLSGKIRALAKHYIARGWNFRDWARYNERHGLPILGLSMPAETDEKTKQLVLQAVGNINNETVMPLPVNEDGSKKYDLKVIEATARSFDSFKLWKGELDTDIAISVLGQNLTTEVKGGSRAAAEIQNQVRIDKRKEDAAIAQTIRDQVLYWYAAYNYKDGDLAPLPAFAVEPPEDETATGNAFKALGDGIASLNLAASDMIDVRTILEQEGIPVLTEEEIAVNKAAKADAAMEQMQRQAAFAPGGGNGGPGGGGAPPFGKKPAPGGPPQALSSLAPTHRYEFQGLPIAVEHAKGQTRVWHETTAEGKTNIGSTTMQNDYGYIEGVTGSDKEELDVYVGPDETAPEVHIVHQQDATDPTKFDEQKTFLGFPSADAAKAAFLAHRNDGERCYGGMSSMTAEKFKEKLSRRRTNSTAPIRLTAMDGMTMQALTALAQRVRAGAPGIKRSANGRRRAARYPDKLQDRATALRRSGARPRPDRHDDPDRQGDGLQRPPPQSHHVLLGEDEPREARRARLQDQRSRKHRGSIHGPPADQVGADPMEADVKIPNPANPGLNGDAILFDDGAGQSQLGPGIPATAGLVPSTNEKRIVVNVFANQIVTVFHEIQLIPGGTWRVVNNAGAGDATTASTLFDSDYYFRSGRNRIRIHTTTAPTTWEVGGRLICDRSRAI